MYSYKTILIYKIPDRGVWCTEKKNEKPIIEKAKITKVILLHYKSTVVKGRYL